MDREREREREREEKEDEEMRRSLQARGKDYNVGGKRRSMGNGKEYDWEQRQQRDEAATILESEEMLLWIAASRNEVCLPCPFLPSVLPFRFPTYPSPPPLSLSTYPTLT